MTQNPYIQRGSKPVHPRDYTGQVIARAYAEKAAAAEADAVATARASSRPEAGQIMTVESAKAHAVACDFGEDELIGFTAKGQAIYADGQGSVVIDARVRLPQVLG